MFVISLINHSFLCFGEDINPPRYVETFPNYDDVFDGFIGLEYFLKEQLLIFPCTKTAQIIADRYPHGIHANKVVPFDPDDWYSDCHISVDVRKFRGPAYWKPKIERTMRALVELRLGTK